MNMPVRLLRICENQLADVPLSAADRAWLENKIHPHHDHVSQRAALVIRDRVLCEAGGMLPAIWKISPKATTLHHKFAQYRDTLWLNGDRLLAECPERHRGTLREKFWQALRQHDAVPAQRTIREILAAGDCAAKRSEPDDRSNTTMRDFKMSLIPDIRYGIESADSADLLPEPAGDKLRSLRQLRDDARNTLRPITLQINELRMERQGDLARLKMLTDPLGAGGQNLDENATSVKDVKRKIAKLDGELKRLREVEEVRAHKSGETSALVQNLEDYLRRGRPSGTIFSVYTGEPPQLKKNENVTDAIEGRRRRLREIAADVHQIESRPLPSSVVKARMREQVERLALAGTPSVESAIWFGNDVKFPTQTLQSDIRLQSEFGVAFGEVHNPIAFEAWRDKAGLIARLDDEIMAAADDEHALSADERAKQLAILASDGLVVQRDEEAAISMAERAGNQILRRPDADPRAVLGIELVSTASHSASPLSLMSNVFGK